LRVGDVRKMADADHRLLGSDRHGDGDEKQNNRCEDILQ